MLALPCRSADEALWLSSRARRGEAGPWGRALLPALSHPAAAPCADSRRFASCRSWFTPRGVAQPLLRGTGASFSTSSIPHGAGAAPAAEAEGQGAVPDDKGVIDTLVCGTANLEQCPLFIPGEARLCRVSSS